MRIFIGRTDAEAETPVLWPSEFEQTPGDSERQGSQTDVTQ